MTRRRFLKRMASLSVALAAPWHAAVSAKLPEPYDWAAMPPTDTRDGFIEWMARKRGEDRAFLGQRYDRYLQLLAHKDLWDDRNKRAYLLTPREAFVTAANQSRAYEWHYLDIGFGVTITGPHTVARMTNTINPQRGERVLEIGTGSGYQAAYLSHLTQQVFSVEVIKPLFERTGGVFEKLIAQGYSEYQRIQRKHDDGYYGWEAHAPFDKIIVTCGIDHVPPPLLQQLKVDGMMVIPVGPPGAQHVLKIVKRQAADGALSVARSDIYNGAIINFVPFTKLKGS